MSIGIVSMLTPLADRIDRWATSGNATQILLHPEDYLKLSDSKREKIEKQYNLPVNALGGERGLQDYLNRSMSKEELEEIKYQQVAATAEILAEMEDES
jgi:hypothetical protein